MDDYTKHQRTSELWDIIDLVSGVQEIEIAELKDPCEAHGITQREVHRAVGGSMRRLPRNH